MQYIKVLVTSGNPVKLNAAKSALTEVFPNMTFAFNTTSVNSGVSVQPLSDAETLTGAITRVRNAQIKSLN